jgi:hypothetical protein
MAWNVIAAYVLDQVFGYQGANKLRENIVTLGSRRAVFPLGGSRSVSLPLVGSVQDAESWIDVEIDGTNLGGFTVQARIECRTLNAGTTITPKIRNMTDSTDAGTGVACSATAADYSGANQKQTITVTLASGVKKYRLQGTPSNATYATFVIGYLEAFVTA